MTRTRVLGVTVFVGRWLWLAVALAVLATGGYLFQRLSDFDDQAQLSANVAELRTFQERMVTASLGEQAGLAPSGLTLSIVLAAEGHAELLRGRLAAIEAGETSIAAIDSYLDGLHQIVALGGGLASGESSIEDVAISYAAISGAANADIDSVLQALSVEGQRTAAELRRIAALGLALIVGGGVAGAAGFGWTTRRAQVLSRDMEHQRELDRVKDEFVALASHELRTPLTGIYGFSQLLAEDGPISEEDRRQWAGHIHSEAGRLTAIVEDLLNVSRIESGTLEIKGEPLPFLQVVESVRFSFDGRSEQHTLETAGQLEATVSGDQSKLVQVLSNLVDNAIQYSPAGGRVLIEGQVDRELLRVSVSDDGIGIAPEHLDKVFERFERIPHPETENVRSTGLGLYVVRELVTRMGGTISVDSTPDAGSRFTFSIPLDRAAMEVAA